MIVILVMATSVLLLYDIPLFTVSALTTVIIVDPHITRCGVHDLIWFCRERLPVAWRKMVTFLLQFTDQLWGAKENDQAGSI